MVTPALRRYWLERYSLEEIVEMAEAIWPTGLDDGSSTGAEHDRRAIVSGGVIAHAQRLRAEVADDEIGSHQRDHRAAFLGVRRLADDETERLHRGCRFGAARGFVVHDQDPLSAYHVG